jgi:hypothetical protein
MARSESASAAKSGQNRGAKQIANADAAINHRWVVIYSSEKSKSNVNVRWALKDVVPHGKSGYLNSFIVVFFFSA